MTTIPDEILEQMLVSDNVTLRSHGVVISWMREYIGEDYLPGDERELAKTLIRDMWAAGLSVHIHTDLLSFIDRVKGSRKVLPVERKNPVF